MFWVWGQPSLETSETEVLGLVLPFKDLNSYFCREKKKILLFFFFLETADCQQAFIKAFWYGSGVHFTG